MNGARPLSSMEEAIRACLDSGKNNDAFELLMSHFQNKVFRLAYSMLGNEALAEEAAQDIFIRVWKALGSYRGQSSLSTWIYSIARNTCLTAISARAARPSVSMEAPGVQRLTETVLPVRETGIDLPLLLSQLPVPRTGERPGCCRSVRPRWGCLMLHRESR